MAAPRKRNPNMPLRPMSEEECAALVGYTYLPRNIRSADVVEAQELHINAFHNLTNGYADPCACQIVNGKKCSTGNCPNWDEGISCSPTCHAQCQNNPWEHGTFAAGRITFVRQTAYGWGVFSTARIPKDTLIGEYTGIVTRDTNDFSREETSYLFAILPRGYVVQAHKQGSIMRCECKCGTASCKGIIGKIKQKSKKGSRRRQGKKNSRVRQSVSPTENDPPTAPPTFRSIIQDATAEVTNVLTRIPRPQERPNTYMENHIFRAAEPAYIITQYNGRLGIVQGRITESYTNNSNITIYVVDVRSPTSMQYHMPRYLCFHYPEDAAYVLQHHIPEEERDLILQYSTPYASREVAEGLEYNMPDAYSQMVIDGTLPATRLERREYPGPVAIGLPSSRLIQCDSCDEQEDYAEEESQDEPAPQFLNLRSGPKQRTGMTAEQPDMYAARKVGSGATGTNTVRNANELFIKGFTERAMIVEPAEVYDPSYRRSFDATRDVLHNLSLVRRNMESAIENVTWFTISRTPAEVQVDYHHLYRQVTSVLEYFYTEARPSQRRFLTVSHFNAANETNRPRSTLECYCSFCNIKFNDDEPLRHHINRFHTIVATYTCSSCGRNFSLPSLFRQHIFECDPVLGLSFILNIVLPMVDAFADYIASRSSNNAPTFVLQPGLPNITRQPGNFKVQKAYTNILKTWPTHTHVEVEDPLPGSSRAREVQEQEPGPSRRKQVREPEPGPSRRRQVQEPEPGPSRRQRLISQEDWEDDQEQDCDEQQSNQSLEIKQRKSKKRSREQRRIESSGSDAEDFEVEEEDDEVVDEEVQRPASTNVNKKMQARKTNKRSRQERGNDNQNIEEGRTRQADREERHMAPSNTGRKTVNRNRTAEVRQRRVTEDDERIDSPEHSKRITRAAAGKGTVKCSEEYSWVDPSSESDDDDHSLYQPKTTRRRK
ncbi:unnamed protein product [Orchesella dallaii]|uniref:Uncharacterized protein n=1 Tax=Orchesella dallaii TaxID=48710 RepID=A0ABP1PST3_9HEXA